MLLTIVEVPNYGMTYRGLVESATGNLVNQVIEVLF